MRPAKVLMISERDGGIRFTHAPCPGASGAATNGSCAWVATCRSSAGESCRDRTGGRQQRVTRLVGKCRSHRYSGSQDGGAPRGV